ncbi:hypothetical protein SAMD00079811_36910 [Scytonema sp. HK-05]|nr:hypothetical protein NIES2130_02905 [Scytonema sp. HK-05]BAY46083.1 hypothetical protein SAMD00079811_36910 [Scytonema sp. HK-05]
MSHSILFVSKLNFLFLFTEIRKTYSFLLCEADASLVLYKYGSYQLGKIQVFVGAQQCCAQEPVLHPKQNRYI